MLTVGAQDVAEFLSRYPPFDEMPEADLRAVARAVEVEFHPTGTVLFEQGELFGQASMLAGLPARFSGVATSDTLC